MQEPAPREQQRGGGAAGTAVPRATVLLMCASVFLAGVLTGQSTQPVAPQQGLQLPATLYMRGRLTATNDTDGDVAASATVSHTLPPPSPPSVTPTATHDSHSASASDAVSPSLSASAPPTQSPSSAPTHTSSQTPPPSPSQPAPSPTSTTTPAAATAAAATGTVRVRDALLTPAQWRSLQAVVDCWSDATSSAPGRWARSPDGCSQSVIPDVSRACFDDNYNYTGPLSDRAEVLAWRWTPPARCPAAPAWSPDALCGLATGDVALVGDSLTSEMASTLYSALGMCAPGQRWNHEWDVPDKTRNFPNPKACPAAPPFMLSHWVADQLKMDDVYTDDLQRNFRCVRVGGGQGYGVGGGRRSLP
jgi:hypothetical protein